MFKALFTKMFDGFLYGIGFLFFSSFFILPLLMYIDVIDTYRVKSFLTDKGVISREKFETDFDKKTTVLKRFIEPRIKVPSNYEKIYVDDVESFNNAWKEASNKQGRFAIVLNKGNYSFEKTIYVKTDNIMIMSATGDPYDVRLTTKGGNLIRVSSNNFYIDGITLSGAQNHLIQVAGESNSSNFKINNSILEDAYEQFLKVSYNRARPDNYSLSGSVTNCVFQFTRGVAPNYYTGGIDALGSKNWIVSNNVFRDIASPSEHIAQHAVHFWVNSSGNQITNNLFIDVDRAIGLGMPLEKNESIIEYSHRDGLIEGNVIYHSDNGSPFADTGIILEAAENTTVKGNYVFFEHLYPNAIEYRFEESRDNYIVENFVNAEIRSRNGGKATLRDNKALVQSEFLARYNQLLDRLAIVDVYKEKEGLN